MSRRVSRRTFIQRTAATAVGVMFLPHLGRGAVTTAANDRLNVACIGVGGKGAGETNWCGSHENLVALCDIDQGRLGEMAKKFPRAKTYFDFRKMLEEIKEIDAVTVVTADHTHYPAAMMALQLDKHTMVQKPLTHTVEEARRLARVARDKKVATQMGNQGHSGEGNRRLCEYIWDGAIGNVAEVHASTNRPIWPQGMDRPKEEPVPPGVHWDDWLGPADVRPYGKGYHPFNWRGFVPFGCGALGDMGCHILDGPVWALKLDKAATVKVSAEHSGCNGESWPKWSIITYEFPAREGMAACKLVWYDGGKMPPRPKELEADRPFGVGGSYFVGDRGTIMSVGDYGGCRIVPEARQKEYKQPDKTIPRSKGMMEDWVIAAKGGPPASSCFDVSGPLTEIVLLGNVAILAGKPIEYDLRAGKITNEPDANRLLTKSYRKGWDFG